MRIIYVPIVRRWHGWAPTVWRASVVVVVAVVIVRVGVGRAEALAVVFVVGIGRANEMGRVRSRVVVPRSHVAGRSALIVVMGRHRRLLFSEDCLVSGAEIVV